MGDDAPRDEHRPVKATLTCRQCGNSFQVEIEDSEFVWEIRVPRDSIPFRVHGDCPECGAANSANVVVEIDRR